MPATTNKQRLLQHVLTMLGKQQGPAELEPLPVLEQFIYAICREGATREQADQAFRALRERFFDWNEVRVSSVREIIEAAFEDLPDRENKAIRLLSFLQEVFETTYSFDLEPLHKKGLKQAAKQLSRYQAASDFAVAWVVQHSLGGHAVPLDAAALRVLRRLGLIEPTQQDPETLRASLEHLIPKAKGARFSELLSNLADEVCYELDPNCAACPLSAECPTGQVAANSSSVPHRPGRGKPR